MAALGNRRGMTLIEVLLAMTLLALLSAGILTTLRMAMNALATTNERVVANRRVLGAQRVLYEQLANFLPATAECGGGGKSGFFDGKLYSVRFATTYSISEAARGAPRIVEMIVIPGKDNRGVRLVVNELPYAGARSTGALCTAANQYLPAVPNPQSFVLADQLAVCRFSYQVKLPDSGDAGPWLPVWDRPEYPRAIRLEMAPLDGDNARLRPLGVTALLHINRYAVFDYVDQ